MLPGRNSENPGIFFPVYSNNGANTTTDVPGFSVSLKSLVMEYEAQQRVAKEEDLIHLKDDGHDSWHWLISRACRGLRENSQAIS